MAKGMMSFTLLLKSIKLNELHMMGLSFWRDLDPTHFMARFQRKFVILCCIICRRDCRRCKYLLIYIEHNAVSLLPAVLREDGCGKLFHMHPLCSMIAIPGINFMIQNHIKQHVENTKTLKNALIYSLPCICDLSTFRVHFN